MGKINAIILAAGLGTRLAAVSCGHSKAMTPVGGVPLLKRQLDSLAPYIDGRTVVAIREEDREAAEFLRKNYPKVIISTKSTECGLDTLYFAVKVDGRGAASPLPQGQHAIDGRCATSPLPQRQHAIDGRGAASPLQGAARTLVVTVDSFYDAGDMARYIAALRETESDALMAVTELDDDEKPLYLHCTEEMDVRAFSGEKIPVKGPRRAETGMGAGEGHEIISATFVSAGIYGLSNRALETVAECHAAKKRRLREFQQALIDSGLNVRAFLFGEVYDLDRPEDLERATNLA